MPKDHTDTQDLQGRAAPACCLCRTVILALSCTAVIEETAPEAELIRQVIFKHVEGYLRSQKQAFIKFGCSSSRSVESGISCSNYVWQCEVLKRVLVQSRKEQAGMPHGYSEEEPTLVKVQNLA